MRVKVFVVYWVRRSVAGAKRTMSAIHCKRTASGFATERRVAAESVKPVPTPERAHMQFPSVHRKRVCGIAAFVL